MLVAFKSNTKERNHMYASSKRKKQGQGTYFKFNWDLKIADILRFVVPYEFEFAYSYECSVVHHSFNVTLILRTY